jgi:DNA (cytosine-5)-methyltransferase 1
MSRKNSQKEIEIKAVDLFCGVGGLTHGLLRGGVKVVAGVDLDAYCRFPYETNNPAKFVNEDINRIESDAIKELLGDPEFSLLAGCAPCQPFSTYGRSKPSRRSDSDWGLVASFGKLIKEVRPHFVTMENVPQLERHPVFVEFLNCLKGYHKSWATVDCASLAIPQTRKRLVLLASRLRSDYLSLAFEGTPAATVRETIASLRPLRAGQADPNDPLHVACKLSDLNLMRIKASKPGGTWRDWPPALRAKCHRRQTGETYPSVYGRMEWDQPSPTITTQCFGYGNGRFGHPAQHRAITLREAAMLQTFPSCYQFVPPGEAVKFSLMGRLIGNAVPVRLGEVIARTFVNHARHHLQSLNG